MPRPTNHQRNAMIRSMLKEGIPVSKIGEQFGLSRERIYQISPGGTQIHNPSGPRGLKPRPPDAVVAHLVSIIDRPPLKLSFAFQSAIQRAREVYPRT